MLIEDKELLFWIENDTVSFIISVILAGLIIPKILLIAFRKKLFDEVNERKVHRGIVPRLGGIAFFPAFLFSMMLIIGLNLQYGNDAMWIQLQHTLPSLALEICAIILLYLVGMADDLIGVRYMAKFMVQICSASLLVCSGMYVSDFYGILWLNEIPAWFASLITAFIVVYVVNAINLIDGIDGLASGLSTIALVFYAIVFLAGGEYLYSMFAAASAGTLFPFFYYNVFGDATKQKKIFMGDTGALTTGMVLVFCALAVMCAKPDSLDVEYNPSIVALSPLIIPCFDVFRVYFHRVRCHRNPFLPDKCHIHHKLLALGINQTVALLTILGTSIAFISVNVLISAYFNPTVILLCDILIWTGLNMLLTRLIRKRERRLGVKLYE